MASLMLYKTNYDLAQCKTGIVHLGYGAFHRAHQSVYIDDYMEKTGDLNWAITAVNLRSSESGAFAKRRAPQASAAFVILAWQSSEHMSPCQNTNLYIRGVGSNQGYT